MNMDVFASLIRTITTDIAGMPVDSRLAAYLNTHYGKDSTLYREIKAACITGAQEGWLCQFEAGGLRYGRAIKPSEDMDNFSVDVVDMKDIAGPYHVHPTGEVDLIMPIEGDALFDGQPAGWHVCEPGSGHRPTVTNGRALVLYLLPEGAIDFRARAPESTVAS